MKSNITGAGSALPELTSPESCIVRLGNIINRLAHTNEGAHNAVARLVGDWPVDGGVDTAAEPFGLVGRLDGLLDDLTHQVNRAEDNVQRLDIGLSAGAPPSAPTPWQDHATGRG